MFQVLLSLELVYSFSLFPFCDREPCALCWFLKFQELDGKSWHGFFPTIQQWICGAQSESKKELLEDLARSWPARTHRNTVKTKEKHGGEKKKKEEGYRGGRRGKVIYLLVTGPVAKYLSS